MRLLSDTWIPNTVNNGFVQIYLALAWLVIRLDWNTWISNAYNDSFVNRIPNLHQLCHGANNCFVNYLCVFNIVNLLRGSFVIVDEVLQVINVLHVNVIIFINSIYGDFSAPTDTLLDVSIRFVFLRDWRGLDRAEGFCILPEPQLFGAFRRS